MTEIEQLRDQLARAQAAVVSLTEALACSAAALQALGPAALSTPPTFAVTVEPRPKPRRLRARVAVADEPSPVKAGAPASTAPEQATATPAVAAATPPSTEPIDISMSQHRVLTALKCGNATVSLIAVELDWDEARVAMELEGLANLDVLDSRPGEDEDEWFVVDPAPRTRAWSSKIATAPTKAPRGRTVDTILACLAEGPKTLAEICEATQLRKGQVAPVCSRLHRHARTLTADGSPPYTYRLTQEPTT